MTIGQISPSPTSPEVRRPHHSPRRLTDIGEAAVFSVLALVIAVGAALAIREFDLNGGLATSALYMITPTAAVVIMMLLITRDGYSKEGWKSLGLHIPGLKAWWISLLAPIFIAATATAIVCATPLASFAVPADGTGKHVLAFILQLVVFTVTLSLFEEIGWRGYLSHRLRSLGRRRAFVWVGLVWAAWHLPLILLTPLYHSDGNRWIGIPLFVATIVPTSFVFGYLRSWTGSVWPAAIAHTAHNAAWGTFAAFYTTSSPVVVNEYLVGESGLFILLGTVVVAIWLDYHLGNRLTGRGSGEEVRAITDMR